MFASGDFNSPPPPPPPRLIDSRLVGACILIICVSLCAVISLIADKQVFEPFQTPFALTLTADAKSTATPQPGSGTGGKSINPTFTARPPRNLRTPTLTPLPGEQAGLPSD